MKKIISLILILSLSLFAFAACGGKDNDDNTPTEKNYSLAIGVATTQSGEKVTNTVAAIVIEDGKIVACRIDCIDVKASLLEDGTVDASKTYQSKAELGDAYDSYSPMPSGRWYQQVEAFAKTAVGKSAAEVAGLSIEGVAGCSIYAGGYRAALEKAANAAR